MRVVVVSSEFPPSRYPEAAHTLFLCERLAAAGVDVQLITEEGDDSDAHRTFGVHRVIRHWEWRQLPSLLGHIRRLRPDAILLIHLAWIYDYHPMITFLPSLCRWLIPSARFVTQFENIQQEENTWSKLMTLLMPVAQSVFGFDRRLGTLLRRSDRIICLAASHLKAIEDVDPEVASKAVVIPAPPLMRIVADADGSVRKLGRERLGVGDDEVLLAFFGFLYVGKGLETLFRAMTRARHRNLRLVIIGDVPKTPYAEMLQQLEAELNLNGRIIWNGHCDAQTDDASVLLRAADVGVFPFDVGIRLNNSSFAAAATHALPLLATAGPDLELEFEHQKNVWLCPPRDPDAMSEALDFLADHPDVRQQLSAEALRLADSCFSWDRVVAATLDELTVAAPLQHPLQLGGSTGAGR